MSARLVLATAAVYIAPGWLPDPPLAFYVLRGWLGCLFAWALWQGWRISGPEVLAVAAWEASSSICGSAFAGFAPALALCDRGTGLPLTLPSLALSLWALITNLNVRDDDTNNGA